VDFVRVEVLSLPDGHDYDQIVGALQTMEAWDPPDRRPMMMIGTTIKGYWPGAVNGKIPGAGDQWWATRAIRTG